MKFFFRFDDDDDDDDKQMQWAFTDIERERMIKPFRYGIGVYQKSRQVLDKYKVNNNFPYRWLGTVVEFHFCAIVGFAATEP